MTCPYAVVRMNNMWGALREAPAGGASSQPLAITAVIVDLSLMRPARHRYQDQAIPTEAATRSTQEDDKAHHSLWANFVGTTANRTGRLPGCAAWRRGRCGIRSAAWCTSSGLGNDGCQSGAGAAACWSSPPRTDMAHGTSPSTALHPTPRCCRITLSRNQGRAPRAADPGPPRESVISCTVRDTAAFSDVT